MGDFKVDKFHFFTGEGVRDLLGVDFLKHCSFAHIAGQGMVFIDFCAEQYAQSVPSNAIELFSVDPVFNKYSDWYSNLSFPQKEKLRNDWYVIYTNCEEGNFEPIQYMLDNMIIPMFT